jgi:glycerate-2-kinase
MKAGDPCFRRAALVLVGSLPLALEAAAVRARELGFRTEIVSRALQGEARDAAHFLAERARQAQAASPPAGRMCLLSGGETTVRVLGSGRGGRNQELALAFAREISGTPGIVMLSAGTDGIDGPTDAAGAIVDGETVKRGEALGLPAAVFLENNDSYGFFSELDARSAERHHVRTGATGTNVMDIQVILFDRGAGQGMATGINRKSEEMDD